MFTRHKHIQYNILYEIFGESQCNYAILKNVILDLKRSAIPSAQLLI